MSGKGIFQGCGGYFFIAVERISSLGSYQLSFWRGTLLPGWLLMLLTIVTRRSPLLLSPKSREGKSFTVNCCMGYHFFKEPYLLPAFQNLGKGKLLEKRPGGEAVFTFGQNLPLTRFYRGLYRFESFNLFVDKGSSETLMGSEQAFRPYFYFLSLNNKRNRGKGGFLFREEAFLFREEAFLFREEAFLFCFCVALVIP